MAELSAQLQMGYDGLVYVSERLEKEAEWRRKQLSLSYDPFTVDVSSAMEESILEGQITKSLFKFYSGLQADINDIESKIKHHEESLQAWYDRNIWFQQKEEIKKLQNKTLLMLFETIEIPATLIIQNIFNDGDLNQAEKHTEILQALPKRIRRGLPYLLKKE